MAVRRVTMKDIADACGLSRNTISKVFNGWTDVPESTRQMVLAKAEELGYNQLPESPATSKLTNLPKIITVITKGSLNHAFGSFLLKSFTDQLSRSNYMVQIYEISDSELQLCKLPPHFSAGNSSGILCMELFDTDYSDMLAKLKIPIVFIDGFVGANHSILPADFLCMENYASSMQITAQMIKNGAKTIGFVGDPEHCLSFHERFAGFKDKLAQEGLEFVSELCILESDSHPYWNQNWITEQLEKMPRIPDAFICANDYHAIHIIFSLTSLGYQVPNDVMVSGFDDTSESKCTNPTLTSVVVPAAGIGLEAADLLMKRIENPDRAYTFTYVQTFPVFRESTKQTP